MTLDRRTVIAASLGAASLGIGAATAANAAPDAKKGSALRDTFREIAHEILAGVQANSAQDQTAALQAAIDSAAEKGVPVVLPSGTIRVGDLRLRAGTKLIGHARSTTLEFTGGHAFISGDKADGLVLRGLVLDGAYKTTLEDRGEGLLTLSRSRDIVIEDVEVRHSARIGVSLISCSGRISENKLHAILDAGIKSLDATGLSITGNAISDCGNNGILVWRSEIGEDGTIVSGNRVTRIRNASGGTGEYGNGINVFRAGSVLVQGNRVADCAFTAIRGNAASNIQIIANSCERLGEVAIYSEFEFQGAVIANNVIDTAATGISVTNFQEGGRLSVIQGNLIRNLFRREHEKEDKRGEGIGVEADAVVSGNTIENAPNVGIQIGWGPFMRDVAATGNVIRRARVGISVTSATDAGSCLIANNVISEAKDGAIRAMNHGAVLGPDLAREPQTAGRIIVTGNVAT